MTEQKNTTVPSFTMNKVKSSNVSEVGYDEGSQTLALKFSSGHTYHYAGVSPDDFKKLQGAKSVGKHIAAEIRPKFKGVLHVERKRTG